MMPRLVLTLIFTVFIFAPLSYATNSKAGTSAAQFLKIGAGARPTGMGDAFVAIADDANAAYFNPAGLATIERPEFTAMHTQWFQGISYEFGAFVYPTEKGAFALSASTLKVDDIERRGTDETYTGNFESLDGAYNLHYARNFSSSFSIGLTGRYIKQEIDNVKANTLAGDIGLLKKMRRLPLSFGFAVKNFGQDVKFREESDPLPLTIDTGLGVHLFGDRVTIGLLARKPRDNDTQYGAGIEYLQPLFGGLSAGLRGGYNTQTTDPSGTTGMTLGGGLRYRQFDLDFAWVPFGDLGNTFRYAVLFRF